VSFGIFFVKHIFTKLAGNQSTDDCDGARNPLVEFYEFCLL